MDSFRTSELSELEEEFLPSGTDFYAGPDVEEPLTDAQVAELENAVPRRPADAAMRKVREEEDDEDEYRGVAPLRFD